MGGHLARRKPFEPMLLDNVSHVASCNAYLGMIDGETVEKYVDTLAQELDDKFVRVRPKTLIAYAAESGGIADFAFVFEVDRVALTKGGIADFASIFEVDRVALKGYSSWIMASLTRLFPCPIMASLTRLFPCPIMVHRL